VHGFPLVEHVAARIAPQVAGMLISANRHHAAYRRLGWPVLADEAADFPGPLAGLLAGLEACPTDWLIAVPCDAPALPDDLVARLAATDGEAVHPRIARAAGAWQPVVVLLHRSLAAGLRAFMAGGGRRVMDWMLQQGPIAVDWPDAAPFSNLNTPEDIARCTALHPAPPAGALPLWVGNAPVIGVAAGSGTGKTTLLEATIPHLVAAGLRVTLVKHAHHEFDIDRPGKDSHRLRMAGACQVVVGSARRIASILERPCIDSAPTLCEFLARIDLDHVDLVLVEGFKRDPIPRLALMRRAAPAPVVPLDDPWLVALASDGVAAPGGEHLLRLDLDDPAAVAAFLIRWRCARRLERLSKGAP